MIRTIKKVSEKGSGWRKLVNAIMFLICAYLVFLGVNSIQQGDQITQTGDRITKIENSDCKQAVTAGPGSLADQKCQITKAVADRTQPLPYACIQIRKTLTPLAIRRFTRCSNQDLATMASPEKPVARDRIEQETTSPQARPDPSVGKDLGVSQPPVDRPDRPSKPDPLPVDPEPVPPAEPTSPEPTTPAPPVTPARPLIDLTPVTELVCELTRPLATIC